MNDPEVCADQTWVRGIFSIYVRVISALAIGGGILAALCLTILTILVFSEVALATLSKVIPGIPSNIPVAWEYSGYLMGVAFMLGSAITLRAGSHIRVTALLGALPNKTKAAFEIWATSVGTFVTGFLSWSLINFTLRSFVDSNVSYASFTPLWIPQAGMTLGSCLLTMAMFERLLRSILGYRLEDISLKVASSEDLDLKKPEE
ncbi:TRAP transporter small permease subunit [Cohaesibacter celericrescens]|uniref:TRAP transporter small permease protein n=1 Tax=Cohaesibacter celericrescens TaxID=2067669 RepID=A0A2N5XVQ5_9HYPH|nr:TRAP transporter small permease [Cohaesibacter celericrescens]PLW78591.1 TRAP transporter small permease [Cohaesibacter celericrescens]